MSDHKTNQAMLPPDPGGLNRALDRVAAEHLREVAPHLAPSAPAPPQPEPVGTLSAVLADVTAERSRQDLRWGGPTHDDEHDIPDWAGCLTEYIRKLLLCGADQQRHRLVQIAALAVAAAQSLDRRRAAPASLAPAPPAEAPPERDALGRLCVDGLPHSWATDPSGARFCGVCQPPPAEAAGEMSPPHGIRCDSCLTGAPHERDRHCYSVAQLLEHITSLRSSREAERQSAERWAKAADASTRERDEAREQREDLANEILAERSDLAAANARAEALSTLRAATVKIVTEALDGAPVVSAVTDLDTQSAREKAARLYARAEEAERRALMAGQDKVAAQRRADSSHRLMENERAARVKAEAERDRLRECHRTAAETVWEVSVARTKVEKALAAAEAEREAYRQDRDLTAHRLAAAEAENGRLQLALNDSIDRYKAQAKQIAAAEAEVASLRVEVSRLRLVYDDPSLDATDGAHPAWWRGSDAGVAGAVRIVNEALDGPLPLVGCVGGADLEAVRQRVAALRASVARLVETGDEARDILNAILDNQYTYRERVDAVDRWVARWAAAKAGRALDAPAGSEARR